MRGDEPDPMGAASWGPRGKWRQLSLKSRFAVLVESVSELPVGPEANGEAEPPASCAAKFLLVEHPTPILVLVVTRSLHGTPDPVVEHTVQVSAEHDAHSLVIEGVKIILVIEHATSEPQSSGVVDIPTVRGPSEGQKQRDVGIRCDILVESVSGVPVEPKVTSQIANNSTAIFPLFGHPTSCPVETWAAISGIEHMALAQMSESEQVTTAPVIEHVAPALDLMTDTDLDNTAFANSLLLDGAVGASVSRIVFWCKENRRSDCCDLISYDWS